MVCGADCSERPKAESDGAFSVTMTSAVAMGPLRASTSPESTTAVATAVRKMIQTLFRVRMRGLEPPRPYGHTDLNRARLPIPPHPRARGSVAGRKNEIRAREPVQ